MASPGALEDTRHAAQGRPKSAVRQALAAAAALLTEQQGGATLAQLIAMTGTDKEQARQTVRNMVLAGELLASASASVDGAATYSVPSAANAPGSPSETAAALAAVIAAWVRGTAGA